MAQRKEDSAPSKKRLKIGRPFRETLFDDRQYVTQELSLAASPLDYW
jgi:hypothetical protein